MSGAVTDTTPWKKLPKLMREEIRLTLVLLSTQLEGMLRTRIRDDGGIYMNTMVGGITSAVVPAGATAYRVQVGTPVEHGAYYELGTKPHGLNAEGREAIRRWVEVKIQPHVISMGVSFESGKALPTGKARVLRGDKRKQAIARVALAIQQMIRKKGTAAHKPMARTLEQLGAPFTLKKDAGGYVYQVDVAGWLEKRGEDLWKRIMSKLPKG